MKRVIAIALALAVPSVAFAAAGFKLSSSYVPRSALVPGYYACRSGLDFNSFTFQFDLAANGTYKMRGTKGQGKMTLAPKTGAITINSGPFASDDTAKTYAMNTKRVSDGNAVIIVRYDFGNAVTDDYCARVR